MIRFDKKRNEVYFDPHGIGYLLRNHEAELRSMKMAAPRRSPFRSQKAPAPTKESPIQKFRRMVEELMREGFSYRDAVSEIDRIEPTLRQRVNELSTLKRNIVEEQQIAAKAAWRKHRQQANARFMKQGRRR